MEAPGPFHGRLLLATLAAAGLGFTILQLGEGFGTMTGMHLFMFALAIAFGYILRGFWTGPAQWVGLPSA